MRKTPPVAACFLCFCLISLFSLFFTGCATTYRGTDEQPREEPVPPETDSTDDGIDIDFSNIEKSLAGAENPDWTEIAPGICRASLPESSNGTKLNLVRIQLEQVTVRGTLPRVTDEGEIIFTGEYAEDLAGKTGGNVAVNMIPFLKGKNGFEPIGVYVNSGKQFSPPDEKYAAILFFKDGKAEIIESQKDIDSIETADFAFGGYWSILKNGKIQDFPDIKNSRTAIGISRTGSMIFILTAEKAGIFTESGISFPESAVLLKTLGAFNAIQMDGGFSSSMAVNGKQISPSQKILFFKKNRKAAVNAVFISR